MEIRGDINKVREYGKESQVGLKDGINSSLCFTCEAKRRDLSKVNHW